MAKFFEISDSDIKSLDGQVAIITGASSGIGLATTQLFLSKGATVVGADLNPPAEALDSDKFTFHKADVTSWPALRDLFSDAQSKHGHIDIVFANAGIGNRTNFLELGKDSDGKLAPPDDLTLQINLMAVTNTVALAVHYMTPKGGNIVLTASCTGYQRFEVADYVAAKHGVIGLLRAMSLHLNTADRPIRINAVAPSWTRSNLVTLPEEEFDKLGIKSQPPSAVANSVGLLVSDDKRHGQCLYSRGGRYVEMEEPMQAEMCRAIGMTGLAEEEERGRVIARAAELASRRKDE